MSRCNYNSKRLIPCPRVSFVKSFIRSPDGTKLGSVWEITINGTICADGGSPDSDGVFWTVGGYPSFETIPGDSRLGSIFRKQEAIRELFSEDGHSLEWQSADGSSPVKCNPRITGINFSEDLWYNTSQYVINAQADIIYINGTAYGDDDFDVYISDATESWSIDPDDGLLEGPGQRTFRVTHNVSATGRRVYDDTGSLLSGLLSHDWAKRWVQPRVGIDFTISRSGLVGVPAYMTSYNHVRSENVDELTGTYGVQESWILASGNAIEDFNISVKTSNSDGLTSVGIDGNIVGLEERDSNLNLTVTKYSNADNKFNQVSGLILNRAQTYAGINLNIIPLSTTITKSPFVGTISYSYEYNNRPSSLIPNARSESIVVLDNYDEDVIAIIPIPGRQAGPIIQDINTKQEKSRSLTIELAMPLPSGSISERLTQKPDVSAISDSVKPTGSIVKQVQNQESWDLNNGRYNLNRAWTYET